ncbi:hypothetical protein LINGRAHAP2_LOCUS7269 [Linum grandiflorum]
MFHGECKVTLQDVANLTDLVVTGDAVYVEYDKEMDCAALIEESIMWHLPDRVLHQFRMEKSITRTELLEGEVMTLLGMTHRRELRVQETME